MGKKRIRILAACLITGIILIGGVIPFGIDYSNNYGYAQKLCRAIEKDDYKKLEEILNQKGNINSKTSLINLSLFESDNEPPLLYACLLGKFDAVQILLEHGANPNIEKKDSSALMLCPYNASDEEKLFITMQILIQKGANVNYKTSSKVSVLSQVILQLCVSNKKYSKSIIDSILRLLIEEGAEFETAYGSNSILLFDIAYKNDEFIEYLIAEKNANINVIDNGLNSPLMIAVKMNSKKSVEVLLAHGANKELKNSDGKTALDIAQEKENQEIIDILFDA